MPAPSHAPSRSTDPSTAHSASRSRHRSVGRVTSRSARREASRAARRAALLVALTLGWSGCGDGGGGNASPPAGDASPRGSIEDAGDGPLSPEELAAYLPTAIDGLEPRPEDVKLSPADTNPDGDATPATVVVPYGSERGRAARINFADLAGTRIREGRRELFALMLDGEAVPGDGEIRRLDDGTVVVTRAEAGEFLPVVELFIADRFHAAVWALEDGRGAGADQATVDRLAGLYEGSGLRRLADGPDPAMPPAAWLEAESKPAVAEALAPCDRLLPPPEVARVCGVEAVVATPTEMEEDGRTCNRFYRPAGGGGRVAFMVTRYGDEARARNAAALDDSPGEYAVEHDVLDDLGDGGSRVHNSGGALPDDYRIRFSQGPVLVEMNTSDSPFDQGPKLCLGLDDLEELARGVNERLLDGDGR